MILDFIKRYNIYVSLLQTNQRNILPSVVRDYKFIRMCLHQDNDIRSR